VVAERLRAAIGQRYRIERELGEGGMAVVFLAQDLKHDRQVALKVLRPELAAYLGPERFLREIHIAAQLQHPNIVPLHDSGDAAGLLFYVMPYVEGATLRQRLAQDGPLPVEDAVRIAGEVADALAYAHDLGVVHRDIKPENVLLSHTHAAIADFGIARALVGAESAAITTGASVGTPTYMSPEQADGDPALDHRADIYSLGCVLYEMLAGRPPYPGPTSQALVSQHASHPIPSVRARRADVPAALDAAITRAMAKAKTDRFADAAEFRAALGGPVPTGARAPRIRRRPVTRRAALAATVAGLAVIGAAAVVIARRGAESVPVPLPPTRATVPYFEDRTGTQRALADQLTDAMIDGLQAVPAVVVTSSASVAQQRGASLDSLRQRFTPDVFVMGRVEPGGTGLRVTVEVLEAESDHAMADLTVVLPRSAAARDSVVEQLGLFVRGALWQRIDQARRRARVSDPQAWELVEQARMRANDAEAAIAVPLPREAFRALGQADSLLGDARRRDRRSDLIAIDLARNAERRAFYVEFLAQVLPALPESLPDPRAELRRSLAELKGPASRWPGLADAHEIRGRVWEAMERHGDTTALDSAIAEYERATELDRHRASAWLLLGFAYRAGGRFAEELLALQHAAEEDVFQLNQKDILRRRFEAGLLTGNLDAAADACRTGFALAPRDMRFNDCRLQLWSQSPVDRRTAALARAYADSLGTGEAHALVRSMRELWVAQILARAGLGDSADATERRATAGVPEEWHSLLWGESARVRVLRGDYDSALTLLALVLRADPTARGVIAAAPSFQPLRADPRFVALTAATAPR
jgi:serine/threonine-protein kinase